ncbi:Saccharopine dehydrogenase-domain-containing protein [Xylariaceae sp. FL0662B]|nr:Saccharopine dehydrogenase-domain-containing protein [Xylariaceae sp. FL0662B]
MTNNKQSRKYDILLLGATGFTGSLTAQHISGNLSTNLKWAIGGRSASRLQELRRTLENRFPSRIQPDILAISLDDQNQLGEAVRKTRVCISVVSYTAVGEAVVRACVENGIDYIDTAAIPPLLVPWLAKYHEQASNAGVMLVHGCGTLSAPMDILSWASAREIASRWSLPTREVILAINGLNMQPSAGTVDTMLYLSTLDPRAVQSSQEPNALSPTRNSHSPDITDNHNRHLLRRDPVLGLLSASSFSAAQNRAFVNRTWGLRSNTEDYYGPNFRYYEYQKAASTWAGIKLVVQNYVLECFIGLLRFAPVRSLVRMLAPAPRTGPEEVDHLAASSVSIEVIATADSDVKQDEELRVRASFSYPRGPYQLTSLFLAQGAASLLHARQSGDTTLEGFLTPATLGHDLLQRIQAAGVNIKITQIPDSTE